MSMFTLPTNALRSTEHQDGWRQEDEEDQAEKDEEEEQDEEEEEEEEEEEKEEEEEVDEENGRKGRKGPLAKLLSSVREELGGIEVDRREPHGRGRTILQQSLNSYNDNIRRRESKEKRRKEKKRIPRG